MLVYEVLAEAFAREGVEVVFALIHAVRNRVPLVVHAPHQVAAPPVRT